MAKTSTWKFWPEVYRLALWRNIYRATAHQMYIADEANEGVLIGGRTTHESKASPVPRQRYSNPGRADAHEAGNHADRELVLSGVWLPGPGTEKRCLENVWVEVDCSEQEEEDPLYVQVWQVVRRHKALGEPGGEQQ